MNSDLVEASQVDLDTLSGAKPRISGVSTAFDLETRKEHVIEVLKVTSKRELTAKGTRVSAMTLTWHTACSFCCQIAPGDFIWGDLQSTADPWLIQAGQRKLISPCCY